jgi:L-lactate utilization protein LutB
MRTLIYITTVKAVIASFCWTAIVTDIMATTLITAIYTITAVDTHIYITTVEAIIATISWASVVTDIVATSLITAV